MLQPSPGEEMMLILASRGKRCSSHADGNVNDDDCKKCTSPKLKDHAWEKDQCRFKKLNMIDSINYQ